MCDVQIEYQKVIKMCIMNMYEDILGVVCVMIMRLIECTLTSVFLRPRSK